MDGPSARFCGRKSGFYHAERFLSHFEKIGLLKFALPRLLSRDRDPALTTRIGFALLILGWGPMMAFHLENIPQLDTLRIHAAARSLPHPYFPTTELTLLVALQYSTILNAAVLAVVFLIAECISGDEPPILFLQAFVGGFMGAAKGL